MFGLFDGSEEHGVILRLAILMYIGCAYEGSFVYTVVVRRYKPVSRIAMPTACLTFHRAKLLPSMSCQC